MDAHPRTTAPYSTQFKHLADMRAHVGKELGITEWVEITQERIDAFAAATEDFQWIHVDPEKSRQFSPYKTTVAHGLLVLSLAPKFAYETYQVGDVVMGVNYGLNRVRYPNATPCGAKIRGRISLKDFEDRPGGARFTMDIIFEIQGQEKPACVAEFIGMAFTG